MARSEKVIDDNKIFKDEILPKGRLGKNNITISISNDLFSKIIDQVLKGQTLTTYEIIKTYGKDAHIAGLLLCFGQLLYEDFVRLKSNIQTSAKHEKDITEEKELSKALINALTNNKYQILQQEETVRTKSVRPTKKQKNTAAVVDKEGRQIKTKKLKIIKFKNLLAY